MCFLIRHPSSNNFHVDLCNNGRNVNKEVTIFILYKLLTWALHAINYKQVHWWIKSYKKNHINTQQHKVSMSLFMSKFMGLKYIEQDELLFWRGGEVQSCFVWTVFRQVKESIDTWKVQNEKVQISIKP